MAQTIAACREEGRQEQLLLDRALVEFADRHFHFLDGNIGIAARDHRIGIAELAPDAIHVEQLLHRAPALIPLAPVGARRQPDREGLGKVFVGMLLRVPAFHVAHELARERDGFVVVAVRPPERPKLIAPFFGLVQRVRVIESVTGLMAQVHHDLPRIFNVVHLRFEALQFGVGQVERDSDDGLHVRAAPFIGEIALGTEPMQPLGVQLVVELLDEALEGRAFQLQAELPNRLG